MKTEKFPWTGCTVYVREHNGYDDSDWYCTYWNGEKFVEDLCGTTRYGFPISAHVDADEEIITLWQKELERRAEIRRIEIAERIKNDPTVGKTVVVIRGRKYKGLTGQIFWRGANQFRTYYRNGYNQPENNQVLGIKNGDTKFFVPMEYVKVVDTEN